MSKNNRLLTIGCASLLAFSIAKLLQRYFSYAPEMEANLDLADLVHKTAEELSDRKNQIVPASAPVGMSVLEAAPEKILPQLVPLFFENVDLSGWLSIQGTRIDGRGHAVIRFDTLHAEGIYELVAAFYSGIHPNTGGFGEFRFYEYLDLSKRDAFIS